VSDVQHAFVIANNGFARLHMFQCEDRENLLKAILEYSGNFVGVSVRLKKESITHEQFFEERFGKFRYYSGKKSKASQL
jgi:DnaJ family protein C protein 13